ncbi:ABC transporter permease [Saccharibacillus sp. CPCC 101409]|uniref:ABC transporter permease n=1 Tax=Saccharibacillus sp. CPCC 101409 TaxID=3058041 RepID=UPI0026724B4B|nr:ABC transporter permease [Saccharibacillus sp. CPCC 101409]MDO3408655.1 ABC transporter permease [Saccharibacillus sp. CPCC 101409]
MSARNKNGGSLWINPVLDKEFRLRMRTPRSFIALLAYVLVLGLLAIGFIYVAMDFGSQQTGMRFDPTTSRMLFYVLSIAQLVLIAFMTPALTAGVISGEREKQTLNILLTTQQSSSAIVLSKLVSSLAFMALIVLATLPVYSIVFLYGGISPSQLVRVFLFYLFTMLLLGALGIMCSTLFKRTIVAVIMTYGLTMFIFLVTGVAYILLMAIAERSYYSGTVQPDYSWVGFIFGLNPVGALISIFEPEMSRQAFLVNTASLQNKAPIALWVEFLLVYAVVIAASLWVAIRRIRPVRRGNGNLESGNDPIGEEGGSGEVAEMKPAQNDPDRKLEK